MATMEVRPARADARGQQRRQVGHGPFVAGEVVLLALALALAIVVKGHPAPLPGDAGVAVGWQHLLLPHHLLTSAVDDVSTIAWPVPQGVTLGAVTLVLLALRRWAAAILALLTAGVADGSSYLIAEFVRRPRPDGHGVHVLNHITSYYSFPSGHVVHAVAYFGFLLFVTTTARWPRGAVPWLLLVRLCLLALILLMGPSRVLEGEHWPSDVLEGALYGLFWLVLAIHAYRWVDARWPRLAGHAPAA